MEELYQIEKINEHLDRVLLPGNVYSYIAQGKDKAILIDTGFGLGPYKSFVEERLNGKPYELILTHGHLDHAGGA
ncbi:MAG: MBL fold metallo-hydrolase, partial [Erysipelotrichaceae bacterium]|nr:MBL fold metallo-hydrolase [Erysipelotrichaceae bacterium]